MLPQDIRALEQQHKRIRVFLTLGVQPCLLRLFEAEWREAKTWDAKSRVICERVKCIADSHIIITVPDAGDDDAA